MEELINKSFLICRCVFFFASSFCNIQGAFNKFPDCFCTGIYFVVDS